MHARNNNLSWELHLNAEKGECSLIVRHIILIIQKNSPLRVS